MLISIRSGQVFRGEAGRGSRRYPDRVLLLPRHTLLQHPAFADRCCAAWISRKDADAGDDPLVFGLPIAKKTVPKIKLYHNSRLAPNCPFIPRRRVCVCTFARIPIVPKCFETWVRGFLILLFDAALAICRVGSTAAGKFWLSCGRPASRGLCRGALLPPLRRFAAGGSASYCKRWRQDALAIWLWPSPSTASRESDNCASRCQKFFQCAAGWA